MPNITPRRFSDPYFADPFADIRRELDQVFERFMGEGFMPMLRPMSGAGAMAPQLDIEVDGDNMRLDVDLPGVDPNDVDITVHDGMLTVKGERREETKREEGGSQFRERRFGQFERRIRLPDSIEEDSIHAQFDKGVLSITAHLKKAVEQERKIQIAGTGASKSGAGTNPSTRTPTQRTEEHGGKGER